VRSEQRKIDLLKGISERYRDKPLTEVKEDSSVEWSIIEYIEFTVEDFRRFKGQPVISRKDIDMFVEGMSNDQE